MIIEDGRYRAPTEAEKLEMEQIEQMEEAKERHRPLSSEEVQQLFLAQNIQSLQVDDMLAVRMRRYYPVWEHLLGQPAAAGMKFTYQGELYEVRAGETEHVFQQDWIPGPGTEALYKRIPELFTGKRWDPIPWKGNMELEKGYYYTEQDKVYVCIRASQTPVYLSLAELATVEGGQYVAAV